MANCVGSEHDQGELLLDCKRKLRRLQIDEFILHVDLLSSDNFTSVPAVEAVQKLTIAPFLFPVGNRHRAPPRQEG